MTRFQRLKAWAQGITANGVNKALFGAQGALVMGIFIFFNPTYSILSSNFAAWGKYLIFPGFMATEVLMAGIATYWFLKQREALFKIPNSQLPMDAKLDQLRMMEIRLAATWIKTALILLSGLAGLGVIPGAEAFAAPLMMAGLGLYAMVALSVDIHDIRRKAKDNMIRNGEDAVPSYVTQVQDKSYNLIGSFLLFTVVACVAVANYIPQLVFQIPGLSPVSVLIGVVAGAATMALAYNIPSESKTPDHAELKPTPTTPKPKNIEIQNIQRSNTSTPKNNYVKLGENIDNDQVDERRNKYSTHTKKTSIVDQQTDNKNTGNKGKLTAAQLAAITSQKRMLFGIK